jgi:hypothetical protein
MKNFFSKTVANNGKISWSSTIDHRPSVIGHRSLIAKRTIMNVLNKNLRIVQNHFPLLQRLAFVILFIISNLLFFQQTQAQPLDPFDGYTCDNLENCTWVNDSLEFIVPGPDTNCKAILYYKHRYCADPLNYIQLQPTAVRINENTACDVALLFYGDTLVTQRIEQLMKIGERELVSNLFNDFYDNLTSLEKSAITAKVIGDTNVFQTSGFPYAIGFIRPACRGICINYIRDDSVSVINSLYAKWNNCGEGCCHIIHDLAYNPFPNGSDTIIPDGYYTYNNYVRIQYRRQGSSGECNNPPTPNTSCNPATSDTNIVRFRYCKNYCTDTSYMNNDLGLYGPSYYDTFGLSFFDKSKTGIYNLDEMPYISEKEISTIPDNILLESKSNEIVIGNTYEIVSIKIVTMRGNELQRINVQPNKFYIPINTSSLQNGMYLIVIESKNGITTKPLIIAR